MKRLLTVFASVLVLLAMLMTAVSCDDSTDNGGNGNQNGKVPEEGITTPWVDYD